MDIKDIVEYLRKHRGKVAGIILGFVFSGLVIKYGIVKALFIALCVGAGYYLGKKIDEQVDFKEKFLRFFNRD